MRVTLALLLTFLLGSAQAETTPPHEYDFYNGLASFNGLLLGLKKEYSCQQVALETQATAIRRFFECKTSNPKETIFVVVFPTKRNKKESWRVSPNYQDLRRYDLSID